MELLAEGIAEFRNALSSSQCQEIIAAFEDEPETRPGVVNRPDGTEVVDEQLKRSQDFLIRPDSPARWLAIDQVLAAALAKALGPYTERYHWLKRLPTTFCGFQIQRTSPGQGFDWHADEDTRRRVALIFYLNEGFEGGETEFQAQGLVYEPRTGSLLMFPPFWTHPHRGREVTAGVKYIVTSFLLHDHAR